jgi:hypothetical protein
MITGTATKFYGTRDNLQKGPQAENVKVTG